MVTVTVHGTPEPFQCWLRPAPRIDINLHCTYGAILDAIKLQQWYPNNCHYCKYRPKHKDDFESHIVQKHPGRLAYPGPCPLDTARALYIVESIERELEDRRKEKNRLIRESKKKEQLTEINLMNR